MPAFNDRQLNRDLAVVRAKILDMRPHRHDERRLAFTVASAVRPVLGAPQRSVALLPVRRDSLGIGCHGPAARLGSAMPRLHRVGYERVLATAHASLSDDAFAAAVAVERALLVETVFDDTEHIQRSVASLPI